MPTGHVVGLREGRAIGGSVFMSNFTSLRRKPVATVMDGNGGSSMSKVSVSPDRVQIENLESRDPGVIQFFSEVPVAALAELAGRALTVGVYGLRAMGTAGHVEVVEQEFAKLSRQFAVSLAGVEKNLLGHVESTFDPGKSSSVSAQLSHTISQANRATTSTIEEARAQLQRLIADSFNPDLTTSCVFKIIKQLGDTRAELDRAFDPAVEGSYMARLSREVDEYFGADGKLGDVIAAQITPIKTEMTESLQNLRDLIVGQAAASQVRRMTALSGADFEAEVEAVLCTMAKTYGDTVERVGARGGDAGPSKRGDFTIQLREGPRFVVEAKDCSSPMSLRGDRGMLAVLRDSMTNRAATFAIGVMRDPAGYPREVGSFNEYDSDKLLCAFGPDGQLLEAAYRWARTTLLATVAGHQGLDIAAVEGGLEEARRALRELGRIEGKARAIAKGADDIQGLVAFQVRRASAALDQAAGGLAFEVRKAS